MDNRPYLTENSKKILNDRYLLKDKDKNVIETPKQLFERVAKCVSYAEKKYSMDGYNYWYDKILDNLLNLNVMPASPYLFNTRDPEKEKTGGLFSCFVINVDDDMRSIYNGVAESAIIFKKGGGVGINFSKLREKDSVVGQNKSLRSSGPLSFMEVYDASSQVVTQAGLRRGASIAFLNDNHPDIEEFITVKSQNLPEVNRLMKIAINSNDLTLKKFAQMELDKLQKLTAFNLSVAISDKFMEAVEKNKNWDLISPHTNMVIKTIKAKKLFNLICEYACKSGDPGVGFMDTVNSKDKLQHLGKIHCSNPCGELYLRQYHACNLIAINLNNCMKNGMIDFEKVKDFAGVATRIGDNAIDVSDYPLDKIEENVKNTRGIGVGMVGFADILIKMGIAYDDKKARNLLSKICKASKEGAIRQSIQLAKERGVPKNWYGSEWEKEKIKVRNLWHTTLPPTGSVALVAGASHSIEPLFNVFYNRRTYDGKIFVELNKEFRKAVEKCGINIDDVIKDLKFFGTIQKIDYLPENIKNLFKSAHDISPEDHVRMQAAAQKYTDSGVSKTINCPSSTTPKDIAKIYKMAHQMKCKGITIFRDGCKAGVLSIKSDEENGSEDLRDFLLNKYSRENMTAKEIADLLDVSESQVFTKLKRFGIKKDEKKTTIQTRERKLNTALKEIILANLLVGNSKITIVEKQSSYRQVSDHLVYVQNVMRKFLDNGISCSEIMSIVTDKTYYYFDTAFNKDIYTLPAADDIVELLGDEEVETLLTRTFMRNLFLVGGVKTGKGGIKFSSKHGNYENLKKIMRMFEKEIDAEFNYKDKDFGNNGIVYIPKKFVENFYNFIESGDNISKINSIQDKTSCPECGGILNFCEGCKTCPGCGYSACSV